MPKLPDPAYLTPIMLRPVNPRAAMVMVQECEACGALVSNPNAHDRWHAAIDQIVNQGGTE